MNPGHPSVLFAEVVTQMGIEPVTTRCLVVVLTTKLLGHVLRSKTGNNQPGAAPEHLKLAKLGF